MLYAFHFDMFNKQKEDFVQNF